MRSLAAAVVAASLAAFALYAFGSAPTVFHGDSAEMQIVGSVGGIPHATGYPGFVLAGRALSWIGGGDPARRVTLMNAAFAALAVGLVIVVLSALGASIWSATVAAALYGLSFTFWRGAQRAEVYSFSVALALLALWRSIVALRSGRMRDALLAAFLLGLVTTGHLGFAMLVAVLGLALAWRTFRARPRAPAHLLALVAAFVIGLTPYLYLVWADTQPGGFNTLRLIDSVVNPLGRPMPEFDSPWERVGWLVRGMNRFEGPTIGPLEPWIVARSLFHAVATLSLFELGPLALLLALAGAVSGFRRFRGGAVSAALAVAAVVVYGAALGRGELLGIFMMPSTLLLALLSGLGLESIRQRVTHGWPARGAAAWASGVAVVLLVALPAHALRVHAARRPIGPQQFQVVEEGDLVGLRAGLVPSLRDQWEPRRFGEGVLDQAPRGALLVARFREYTNLQYLQQVEKRRTDLTIEIMSPEGLSQRLERWRRRHPDDPIVFVTRPPEWVAREPGLDSLRTASGAWLYLRR